MVAILRSQKNLLIFLGMIVILAAISIAKISSAKDGEEDRVKRVTEQALVLNQSLPFYWEVMSINDINALKVKDDESFQNQAPGKPVKKMIVSYQNKPNLSHKIVFNDAQKTAWQKKANHLINQLFIENTPIYNEMLETVQNSQALSDVPSDSKIKQIVGIDGGVRDITFESVTFNDKATTAVVTGTEDVWASYAQYQDDNGYVPASPHNIMNFEVSLKKVNNKWMVDDINEDFEPGSAP